MDFAPYQDHNPETERALSPPLEGRRSFSPNVRPALNSPALNAPRPGPSNPWAAAAPSGSAYTDIEASAGRGRLEEFETSLPIRLDYEACLAYLLLPPAGGVLLLLVEHKSDYVRYVLSRRCRLRPPSSASSVSSVSSFSPILFLSLFYLFISPPDFLQRNNFPYPSFLSCFGWEDKEKMAC